MKSLWFLSFLALLTVGCATTRQPALTNGDIISLTTAGMSDADSIHRVEASRRVFYLSTGEVANLRQAGVSDGVIAYLRETAKRFAASEKRRSEIENDEWHQRYGLWYGR